MTNKRAITQAKMNTLSPFPTNARVHTRDQIHMIANSLSEFGWVAPVIVDENLTILAGHGRIEAAKLIEQRGMPIPEWPDTTKVPVRQILHLSEEQKRAFVIADNKIALVADWDEELLADELRKINEEMDVDVMLTGFNERELVRILEEGSPVTPEGPGTAAEHVIIVTCGDENEQKTIYEELTGRGLNCKVQSL